LSSTFFNQIKGLHDNLCLWCRFRPSTGIAGTLVDESLAESEMAHGGT
jgi:hypothetical protein